MSRYTRPEVLKVSCKTQYFRVFHNNGHENCMYLMDFVAFSSIFCEKHIFLLTDFKGYFYIILDVRCFSSIFTFFEHSTLLAIPMHLMFLLNFSVFSSLLLEQYRVTKKRKQKKQKNVFHVLPSKNPWASHEKP